MRHIHKTHARECSAPELITVLEAARFAVVEFEPHVNTAVRHSGHVFSTDSITSRIATKWLSVQKRLFEQVGIVKNTCVADWFWVTDVE